MNQMKLQKLRTANEKKKNRMKVVSYFCFYQRKKGRLSMKNTKKEHSNTNNQYIIK